MTRDPQIASAPFAMAEILRVLEDVDAAKEPKDILNSMLDRALVIAKASRAEIALWNNKVNKLQIVAQRGKRGLEAAKVGDYVPARGVITRVWNRRSDKPIVEKHPVSGKGYHEVDIRTQAEAAFRLHRRGNRVGVLNVEWFNRANLTPLRITDLVAFAKHAALAMSIVDHGKLLADLAGGLASKHDVTESICRVLEGIRENYGFKRVLVYKADSQKRCLDARFILTGRRARAVKNKPWSYSFDEPSLAGHVYATGRPCYLSNPRDPKWIKRVSRKGLDTFGINTPLLALPLLYGGKRLGSIVVWSDSLSVPSERDRFIIQPIADLVAAYMGASTDKLGADVSLNLLRTVLLQCQMAISPEDAISSILHAIQAFGFDRARYLRYDSSSNSFIRGYQYAIGNEPCGGEVKITTNKSPYASHLINTFHNHPDARIYDPRASFGPDPDCKRLGKSPETPWVAAPVALQGRLIGQLAADNEISKRAISPTAESFMTLAAGVTALVLSHISEIDFSLLNAIPVAMFRKDATGCFLSVNERFASDVGLSIEAVKQLRDSDLYHADLAAKYRADDLRVMKLKRVDGWVEENISRKRKTFVHVVKAPLFDATRRVIGVQGLYFDEPYRAIFEHSTEGIYQSTPAGKYLDANTAMARLLGFSDREALLKADVNIGERVYASPGDREYFRHKIRRNKGSISNFEYYLRRQDGRQTR